MCIELSVLYGVEYFKFLLGTGAARDVDVGCVKIGVGVGVERRFFLLIMLLFVSVVLLFRKSFFTITFGLR